jgi:8-oxo-dGTP diphosphatase
MSRVLYVAAVAMFNPSGQVLLAQRPAGKPMAGLWEFPGGKIEGGERPDEALVRELSEELGIKVNKTSLRPVTFASHDYAEFHLFMPLFALTDWVGTPEPKEGQILAWVGIEHLFDYPCPEADLPLFEFLSARSGI